MSTDAEKVAAAEAAPYYFTRSGYYYFGYGYQGSNGNYWSRTPDHAYNAYYFSYDASGFAPQGINYKIDGFSVRCVFGS